MQDSPFTKKFKELSNKYIKIIQLQKLDHHESLSFLYKNYRTRPSEIITAVTLFILILILILDGCNVIASVACFLFPLIQCLTKMGAEQSKKRINLGQINSQEQNSRLTDEQFSQILSSNKREQSTINVYIVYFISYVILEVFSFIMVWIIGNFSWLIVRCVFAFLMLSKQTAGASKVLRYFKKEASIEEEVNRRKADLFDRMS